MKKLSLQWRITLMTALLIALSCIAMNFLIGYSGRQHMEAIGDAISRSNSAAPRAISSSHPETMEPDPNLVIVIHGAKASFTAGSWYITAAVTVLSAALAYFVSGQALIPLRRFAARLEKIQPDNLPDMKISEDVPPEFIRFRNAFNCMLDRLNEGFRAQCQFTGNAAHELRTPLALMQAKLELFLAEHPAAAPETAELLHLLGEQTERMTQMTKTLLEMSSLQTVPCSERIQLAPLIEELFEDLTPLAEKKSVALIQRGDGTLLGSDTLIYRLLFNLAENAIRYNHPGGSVTITVSKEKRCLILRVSDTGCGIPAQYQESIFQPFFRVEQSRSRKYGGVGLGLALVREIVALHGGTIWVEASSSAGSTMALRFPAARTIS